MRVPMPAARMSAAKGRPVIRPVCHEALAFSISGRPSARMPADFPFDVVAFDLDGTLADTAPDLTAALNHALGVLGRPPVPPEDVRHMVGHGARALLQKGLAATGEMTEELVEQGFPIFIDYYLDH